ncbi:hypothetical protein Tco_0597229 [Tanacetum coccineum]
MKRKENQLKMADIKLKSFLVKESSTKDKEVYLMSVDNAFVAMERIILTTLPKRAKDSQYFKDKMLLMEAKEKGATLDAEAEAFLADVEYVDESPNAAAAFMANLSSTSATNSQVNEVHSNDNEIFDNVNDQMSQEMQQEEHSDFDAENEIDENTISYDQYLLDKEAQRVPTEISADTSDKMSMIAILTDLQTKLDGHAKDNQEICLDNENLKNELLQCKLKCVYRYPKKGQNLILKNKVRSRNKALVEFSVTSVTMNLSKKVSGRSRSELVKDPEPPSVPPTKQQVDDLFQWFDDDEVIPPLVVPIPPVNVHAAPAPENANSSLSTIVISEGAPAVTESLLPNQIPLPDTSDFDVEILFDHVDSNVFDTYNAPETDSEATSSNSVNIDVIPTEQLLSCKTLDSSSSALDFRKHLLGKNCLSLQETARNRRKVVEYIIHHASNGFFKIKLDDMEDVLKEQSSVSAIKGYLVRKLDLLFLKILEASLSTNQLCSGNLENVLADLSITKGTIHMGSVVSKDSGFEIKAFADDDYARVVMTQGISTSGSAQFLGHRPC